MKSKLALSFISLSLFAACLDTQPVGQPEIDDVARLASNGLLPGQAQSTTLDQAALTSSAVLGLTANSDSRLYLSYIVSCAFNSQQAIVSGGYTFPGSTGLAINWATRALTVSEGHWVSACVLARMNYSGTNVTISMRGSSSALNLVGTEGTDYQTQEGAFYGTIFGNKGVIGYACNGTDQANHDGYGALALRECANSDPNNPGRTYCNFFDESLCTSACTTNGGTGGSYTGCTTGSSSYAEVITTYVFGTPQ